jgi:hypothetical protein
MGKAKDGSECYTRTGKGGGKYVTCEGTQKGGAKKKAETARKELRKKVPEKKKVTKAQFENARRKLAGGTATGKSKNPAPKKKLGVKIEKPKEVKKSGKVIIKYNDSKNSGTFKTIDEATDAIQKKFSSNNFSNLRIYGKMERALADGREVGFKVKFMLRAEKSRREEAGKDKPSDDNVIVTPYYTDENGSIVDTRKVIAKIK